MTVQEAFDAGIARLRLAHWPPGAHVQLHAAPPNRQATSGVTLIWPAENAATQDQGRADMDHGRAGREWLPAGTMARQR